MARDLSPKRTVFYRALIEVWEGGSWEVRTAFGPYSDKSKCVDASLRWSLTRAAYEKGTRRCRKQVQCVDRHTGEIAWRDVEFDD